jgi:hypothetical protein
LLKRVRTKRIPFKSEGYAHVVLGVKIESSIRDAWRAQQSEAGDDWHLHFMQRILGLLLESLEFLLSTLLSAQLAALSTCTSDIKTRVHEFDKRFDKSLPCPLTMFTTA